MPRPAADEAPGHVARYIALVPEGDILPVLAAQRDEVAALVGRLTDAEALARHAPYTWSVKEVIGHVADGERVFGYRATRFARGDETPLPGYDENVFMASAGFDRTPLADLVAEWDALRRANLLMFGRLTAADWDRRGTASGDPVSVRAMAYTLAGHARHHLRILATRLGK